VDNYFNIYTFDYTSQTLQKWPPGAKEPINLFEGLFQNSPIFYHSASHSLYFFYILKNKPSVYKLVNGSSVPVNAINVNGKGSALNQLSTACTGLYVAAAGDIFIIDTINYRVVKWAVNATSGVLVAGGNGGGSGPNQLSSPFALAVDELNNVLYVVDGTNSRRILRYTNESANGVAVLGGGPHTIFSNVPSEYVEPIYVLVDKMGNLLVSEIFKITRWIPNIKSNFTVFTQDKDFRLTKRDSVLKPSIMTFDKLENLYVYDSGNGQVVKFKRNSTSCTNNLY
jgi:hypothetical protein